MHQHVHVHVGEGVLRGRPICHVVVTRVITRRIAENLNRQEGNPHRSNKTLVSSEEDTREVDEEEHEEVEVVNNTTKN